MNEIRNYFTVSNSNTYSGKVGTQINNIRTQPLSFPHKLFLCLFHYDGDSRYLWFLLRRAGFKPVSGHVGFVVDKLALGQVFSEYFGFPCQSLFHQLLYNHPHLSSGACTTGQKWPQYLADLIPPHQEKNKKEDICGKH
jgi:hypothetical protein